MSEYPFAVRPLSPEEGGGYLIEFPDLPGCMSDGETVEEAIRNGEEAKRDWIAAMEAAGRRVPLPATETFETYSGKWQLRAPKSLHRRLAEQAKRENISLNTLAVTLLAEGLGERRALALTFDQIDDAPGSTTKRSKRTKFVSGSPGRGNNARMVEEVLRASAPRALRPAEIRTAVQRDRGVALGFTSIRHALGQLEERRAVEQVGDGNSWRYPGAVSGSRKR